MFSSKPQWLRSKQNKKVLKAKGFGNKPRVSDGLTDDEIETLYAVKCLGAGNLQAIINTLWI